jgi:hypothetical protein
MITHWSQALSFACFQNVIFGDPTFHVHTHKCPTLVAKSAMLLDPVGIALCAEGVAITLYVFVEPPVSVLCVEQSSSMVSTSVEVCPLHLVHVYSVLPVMTWM